MYDRGRAKKKVYVYFKDSGKFVRSFDSINDFRKHFYPDVKGIYPLFHNKDYHDQGAFLASIVPGGREVVKKHFIDNNKYTLLSRDLSGDYEVEMFNLKGIKIAEFKNIRIASEITKIHLSTIIKQCNAKRMDSINKRGFYFKKKAT